MRKYGNGTIRGGAAGWNPKASIKKLRPGCKKIAQRNRGGAVEIVLSDAVPFTKEEIAEIESDHTRHVGRDK